jgi:division protein CdvB (Snf7/Vps24/ESCRT-III family)
MVLARNTISGQIANVSPKMLEHPQFKDILEVVDEGAKPYVAELYKSGTKQEKAANKSKKADVVSEDEIVAEDEVTEIYPEIKEEN